MSVLFWGFANEVTSVKDAKRYYAILGLGANVGTMLAGQLAIILSSEKLYQTISIVQDRWGQSLILLTILVIFTGIVAIGLYRYLTVHVFKDHQEKERIAPPEEKDQLKMGMRKNFAYLAQSRYLIYIAILVLGYNISLNLIEVVWKDQLRTLCPDPADYNAYMGKVLIFIGLISTIVSAFICGNVIRKYGWTVSALFTPIILLVTGILFFSFLLFEHVPSVAVIASWLGSSPLGLCVFFGAMQNCFSRAGKFTFFDATKEIAFIPLSRESKLKGKAAIDGVGSRIGKSGGSLVHQCLLMIFGSVSLSTPYVAVILSLVFVVWIIAVRSLGHLFAKVSNEEPVTRTAPAPAATYQEATSPL
jgi:AAA family ATP:ADP antiporter